MIDPAPPAWTPDDVAVVRCAQPFLEMD